eukprot:EG_transcript_15122
MQCRLGLVRMAGALRGATRPLVHTLRPAIRKVDLPRLQRHDPDRLDCAVVPRALLRQFPDGAPWAQLLPVVKFLGYHSDVTDKALWASLAAQAERCLAHELRLTPGAPPAADGDNAERARREALAEQLVFCAECFALKYLPVSLRDAFAAVFLEQLRLGALPPAPAARLYSVWSGLRKPEPALMGALAQQLVTAAPLLPVYYATLALRAIQTQEQATGFRASPELSAAKAALLERYNRPVWRNPQGTALLRRKPVLDLERLRAGEITDEMRRRLKPETLRALEEAKAAGQTDLTPLAYPYPLASDALPVHRKWQVRYRELARKRAAKKERKDKELLAKGVKIKKKKKRFQWRLK